MPFLLPKLVALAAASAVVSLAFARRRRQRALNAVVGSLRVQARSNDLRKSDEQLLNDLPPPVARYLNHVLAPQKRSMRLASYEQAGALRTSPLSQRWMRFSASQLIAAAPPAFVWEARVAVLPLIHLQVQDSYLAGIGAGQVALLSAIAVAGARGNPEINSGALHRFLAEAVWCPGALLPSPRLSWQPIDESRALASLSDGAVTVSLEFRFNSRNEVAAIYTPGRWGLLGGGYKQLAWEGRFYDYIEHDGIHVPGAGEVGWYLDGKWHVVWRGQITRARFE